MSDEWKKKDRECPPCSDCGTDLYEKFWGNGGWAQTEMATEQTHGKGTCVAVLKRKLGASSNYVADTETCPHKVTFQNGRTVEVGTDGSLVVGWATDQG